MVAENKRASGNVAMVPGICIFLAAITWLVFGQTLGHEFVNYDDPKYVTENAEVTNGLTLRGIEWAFTHSVSDNWHPLAIVSHMLDCQLHGLKAGWHHGTNVVLHMLAVVLLFLVLREATGMLWRSAFVAAVFAIHPLHVESVAWVAERKDVLSGLFFMLTLAAYVGYARKPSLGAYLLVTLMFVFGLMSKPMLVTVPFVLFVLDYWPLGRFAAPPSAANKPMAYPRWLDGQAPWRKLTLEKLPLLMLSATSCMVTFVTHLPAASSIESLPVWVRVYNAFISYVMYVYQMLWPSRLALFYPYPSGRLSIWPLALAIGLLVAITIGAFRLRKQDPYFLAGWLWYLTMLVPVLGIVQVGTQGRADRYTYLPHIGLYLAITWAIADLSTSWRHRRKILALGMTSTILTLTWCAWTQTSYWKNSESLWRHTLAVTQNNAVAHNNLGSALDRKGLLSEAIFHFRKAVELSPDYPDADYNLGMALFREGRLDEAIACLQKMVSIHRDDADAHASLGDALLEKGLASDAIAHYEESLKIAPQSPEVLNKLAWALSTCSEAKLRNGPRAIHLAEQADQLAGRKNPLFIRTLGAAYAEDGRFKDAIDAAQKALELAGGEGDSALASRLRMDIDLYRINLPLH